MNIVHHRHRSGEVDDRVDIAQQIGRERLAATVFIRSEHANMVMSLFRALRHQRSSLSATKYQKVHECTQDFLASLRGLSLRP